MATQNRKSIVEKQLSASRLRLLDLTMRNKLLNYYATKRRSIEIANEDPMQVFERLVISERALTFRALFDEEQENYDDAETPVRFDFLNDNEEKPEAAVSFIKDESEPIESNVNQKSAESSNESAKDDNQQITEPPKVGHFFEVGDPDSNIRDEFQDRPKRFVDPPPLTIEAPESTETGPEVLAEPSARRYKDFISQGIWTGVDLSESEEPSKSDTYLDTPYSRDELDRKLFFIHHEAHSILEEQGYNVLHIAVGLLEWFESDISDIARLAPVVLLPVTLTRNRIGGRYSIKWSGDDPMGNISLIEKLKEQFVDIPEFTMPESSEEEKTCLNDYFTQVAKAIAKKPKWKLHLNLNMDFFSFTKFVMYKDLDPAAWPEGRAPAEHSLILELFAPTRTLEELQEDDGFLENEIDLLLTARDMHHIRDADPSQIAVIEDVKNGRNLVVEGPPGTGKSQTITNAIAELIYMGKSVLFVSEKMAALEVVKSRLDEAGLGDFCLEIHSNKANKREALREIARVSALQPIKSESLDVELDKHTALRDELDAYASVLKTKFGQSGFTLWKLYNDRIEALHQLGELGVDACKVDIADCEKCDLAMYGAALDALDDIAQFAPSIGEINEHPWRGFCPDVVTQNIEREVAALTKELYGKLNALLDILNEIANSLPVNSLLTLRDAELALHAANLFSDVPQIDPGLLNSTLWDEKPPDVDTLINIVADFRKLRNAVFEKMIPTALENPVADDATKFSIMHKSIFKFLNPSYYSIRKKAFAQYKEKQKVSDSEIARDLVLLADVIDRRKKLRNRDTRGKELFGSIWKCDETEAEILTKTSEWLQLFRKLTISGTLTESAADFALSDTAADNKSRFTALSVKIKNALFDFDKLFVNFSETLKPDFSKLFNTDKFAIPLNGLVQTLDRIIPNVSMLQRWSQYVELARIANETFAAPLVLSFENGQIKHNALKASFKFNFAESMIEHAIKTDRTLAMFDRDLHEGKIKRFIDLERTIIEEGRKKLVADLTRKRPRISGGGIPGSALGVLAKEMAKKRGHRPLRRLFSIAISLIQKIKPCFMMSPLSIAQFLDPTSSRFDVIIFDEASQVRPEDALGALLRGAQLVVMGDDKQLPPTSFFDRVVDPADEQFEEDEFVESNAGLESILGLAKTAFPCKPLKWHYRSRHESLIAVSNYRFYDNMLWIYPSPITDPEELGLSIVHLPETVYDRGKSRTNKQEAAAVVKAAIEHFQTHPDKSLGIGAFSISQQQAILIEVERAIRENPEVEPYFRHDKFEHFFVKNLETIQGDERDVIFISVGYGKDKDGKLSMNFGPLNQTGGERRLNVLITRAREKCVVFSNFKADDIRIGAQSEGGTIAEQGGVAALKQFLKFAETRILEDISVSQKESESPFEKSVRSFLEVNGYKVESQVGCAGFRVDLGVVSTLASGRYVAGIECDGWKYHSSPVARDRDRLRQQVLERLGWRIIRVWSTDWYRSRDYSQQRLIEDLKNAVENERNKEVNPATSKPNTIAPQATTVSKSALTSANDVASSSPPTPTRRDDPSKIENGVVDYEVCKSFGVSKRKDILNTPIDQLAIAVVKIVETEWPVHIDEVMKRLREHWGLARIGSNIESQIKSSVSYAIRQGLIINRSAFLYIPSYFAATNPAPMRVRKRDVNLKPDIELIAPEEIEAAMRIVIAEQYSIYPDELVKQAAYLIGFKAVSEQTRNHVLKVLDDALSNSRLHLKANGMDELPN